MRKKITLLGAITMVAILCITGCTSTTNNKSDTTSNTQHGPPPQQTGTEISIPLSDISQTARILSYDADGTSIRYFVVKDPQGNVHAAFDACDVCYPAKKGYKQVGGVMQCLNCGRQFAITSIGTENTNGGCWPSYLPMTNNGSSITIKIADLADKAYMFE
jgi:uncharacterized membrane protein